MTIQTFSLFLRKNYVDVEVVKNFESGIKQEKTTIEKLIYS